MAIRYCRVLFYPFWRWRIKVPRIYELYSYCCAKWKKKNNKPTQLKQTTQQNSKNPLLFCVRSTSNCQGLICRVINFDCLEQLCVVTGMEQSIMLAVQQGPCSAHCFQGDRPALISASLTLTLDPLWQRQLDVGKWNGVALLFLFP